MEHDESLFRWDRVRRFTSPVWTVLLGTLLVRTTYFMAWPFLIVFLYQDYHAGAVFIGATLALSATVGSFTGLYAGYLSDRFGRKVVMVVGALIAIFSFGGIGLANQLWQFTLLVIGTGLMRPMIEAPAKSVIGDSLENKKDRELALNLRYFLINFGGAIGPLMGIGLALAHPQVLFLATGASYLIYCVVLTVFLPSGRVSQTSDSELPNFAQTLRVISKDNLFIKMLVANFLLMFIYGQIESSLPQIIVRSGFDEAATWVSGLVLVNTVTVIIFQFPMLKLMERTSLFMRTRVGMSLVALSQIVFLFASPEWPEGWYLAAFILALGEVITFPTLGVQIDRLAPPHLRGSYFGAAALYSLGFAVAPVVGGVLIAWGGSVVLFGLCFIMSMVMMGLYWLAEHQPDSMVRDNPASA